MKIWIVLAATLLVTIAAAAQAPAQEKPAIDWEIKAREAVQMLAAGQFDKVKAQFDEPMKTALPHGKLEAGWSAITKQIGSFQKITGAKVEKVQVYERVLVTCNFEKADVVASVVFNTDGKLSGLLFRPPEPEATWTAPDYANEKAFHEQELTVVNGNYELPATLTLPVGPGPFPTIVLVQGSGPHDQDETIGPNKPFKDLAWGLATQGVAMLRYTKRTLKYGGNSSADPKSFTVDDETISDARAAVALAAKQPGVDPKHVYLLGHSLGGMLAPRIATGDPQIAGAIVMAGNTRPIEQLIVEQLRYIGGLPGADAEQSAKQIAAASAALTEIEDPRLKPGVEVNVLGAVTPSSYWLDLRGYHPADAAAKLSIPMLILQGSRDYQVTMTDFKGWQKAMAGHPNATLRMYPALNHLFIEGSAPSTPADYEKPGHVASEVIGDIAKWIAAQSNRA